METRKKRLTAPELAQLVRVSRGRLLAELARSGAAPGSPLPGERVLSAEFGVPLSVIRRLLGELRREGVVTGAPRSGLRLTAAPGGGTLLPGRRIGMVGYLDRAHPRHQISLAALICLGMEPEVARAGCSFRFFNTYPAFAVGPEMRAQLAAAELDGLVYLGYRVPGIHLAPDSELEELQELRLPVVAVEQPNPWCHSVDFDHCACGAQAGVHLLELGRQRLGLVGFPQFRWFRERLAGMRGECARRGVAEPEVLTLPYPPTAEAVRALLAARGREFDALAAANDELAAMILAAASELGLAVPGALAVMGFDDAPGWRHWDLTTVRLSGLELGRFAWALLRCALAAPGARLERQAWKLAGPLLVRSSTVGPAGVGVAAADGPGYDSEQQPVGNWSW